MEILFWMLVGFYSPAGPCVPGPTPASPSFCPTFEINLDKHPIEGRGYSRFETREECDRALDRDVSNLGKNTIVMNYSVSKSTVGCLPFIIHHRTDAQEAAIEAKKKAGPGKGM